MQISSSSLPNSCWKRNRASKKFKWIGEDIVEQGHAQRLKIVILIDLKNKGYSSVLATNLLGLDFDSWPSKSISDGSLLTESSLLKFWFQPWHFYDSCCHIISYPGLDPWSPEDCFSLEPVAFHFSFNSWPSDCLFGLVLLGSHLWFHSWSMKSCLSHSLWCFNLSLNSWSPHCSLDCDFSLSSWPLKLKGSIDPWPSKSFSSHLVFNHGPPKGILEFNFLKGSKYLDVLPDVGHLFQNKFYYRNQNYIAHNHHITMGWGWSNYQISSLPSHPAEAINFSSNILQSSPGINSVCWAPLNFRGSTESFMWYIWTFMSYPHEAKSHPWWGENLIFLGG